MTTQQIRQIAREQSAVDCNCSPDDFLLPENKVVLSAAHPQARRYLELPFLCHFVSYGHQIVASVREEYREIARDYISRYPAVHCFETPHLHVLSGRLRPLGADVCFMAEYWLPDLGRLHRLPCRYGTRLLHASDFAGLYQPQWSNALCRERKELDVLGVGAYDRGELVGLAACSADCDTMWQIGVDVLPQYRRKGIASALTSALACEILARGKVPFYCCAWSNVASARNAVRSGFSPSWVEMTAKPLSDIAKRNGTAGFSEAED